MPFVDDPNQNDESGVAGAAPLGQGMPQETAQENTGMTDTSSAEITSGAQPKSTAVNKKKASPASSGMFNNIQKYVEKNKPQAQKMAGAVTSDISKQAANIRANAEQKQTKQQDVLNLNQQRIDESRGQAQSAINQINGTEQAENTPQYEAASAEQFQDLMSGKVAGQQDVGDLNLSQQKMRSDALSQLAQGTNTEQGRRNLLGETFQKRGQYTRGQSGLDQLITSGDKTARESLIQGTQDTAGALGTQLGDITQQQAQAKSTQDLSLKDLGSDITAMAENPLSGINENIDASYEKELADRAALFGEDSPQYQQALEAATTQQNLLQTALGGGQKEFASYLMDQLVEGKLKTRYGNRDSIIGNTNLMANLASEAGRLEDIGYVAANEGDYWGKGKSDASYKDPITGKTVRSGWGTGLDTSHYKERQYMRGLTEDLQKQLGLGDSSSDLYGLSSIDKNSANKGIGGLFQALQGQYGKIQNKTSEQLVQERLTQGKNIGYDDLVAGADIDRLDVADQSQVDKINALKNLMGREDVISQEQLGDQDFASSDSLSDILDLFGKV